MQPKEVLFRNGEDSQSGIFIVVEGGLGVYLDEGDELRLTNILRTGESVGDLDVLDGSFRPLCHHYLVACTHDMRILNIHSKMWVVPMVFRLVYGVVAT